MTASPQRLADHHSRSSHQAATAAESAPRIADWNTPANMAGRDLAIDTMRGIAILMVIGIHALAQPLGPREIWIDAVLRPCVPIFLFASGYLSARSGRVPLAKRLTTALIPYAIAFVAAYVYMALHNPAMDHRVTTTLARFGLGYVFVYYYVFIYVGCSLALWLVFRLRGINAPQSGRRLTTALLFSIMFGLLVGSYLDPLLLHLGFSQSLVEEVRMRNIPFWFCFVALGVLVARFGTGSVLRDMRWPIAAGALLTYAVYASVRRFGIGDAADYDSVAFLAYAGTLCLLLHALDLRSPWLAALGSGSYFIYLWHIFLVMVLRDHGALRQLGVVTDTAVTFALAALGSIVALMLIRRLAPPRVVRWLGA